MTIAEKLRQEGIEIGFSKGEQIGLSKGVMAERKAWIQTLLRKGFDLFTIMDMTELSREEVERSLHFQAS